MKRLLLCTCFIRGGNPTCRLQHLSTTCFFVFSTELGISVLHQQPQQQLHSRWRPLHQAGKTGWLCRLGTWKYSSSPFCSHRIWAGLTLDRGRPLSVAFVACFVYTETIIIIIIIIIIIHGLYIRPLLAVPSKADLFTPF